MDISKLTDSQINIANKVINEAIRQDVNPDYALSIAYAENKFGGATSKKGAIGPMQLMPDTAKMMGVDPNDEDQNILGGVKYIKYLTQQPNIGSDPLKVAIGYNAGHNHKFFTSNDVKDLSGETIDYTNGIMDFNHGNVPNVLRNHTDGSQGSQNAGSSIFGESMHPQQSAEEIKKDKEFFDKRRKETIAGTGATVGLGVGTAAEAVYGAGELLNRLSQANPSGAPELVPKTNNPVINWSNATTGGNSQLSPIEQAQQGGYREIHSADKEAAEKMKKVQSLDFGKGATFAEESPNILQPKTKTIPNISEPIAPMAKSEGLWDRFIKHGLIRLPISAFGGAMAALDANNAYNEGLTPKGVLSGLSALGGGLQMIPSIPTELAGAALQAPLVAYDLADYGTQKISPLNRQQIDESINSGSVYP